MVIDIEVIFTGLCLFCLNTPGSMCDKKDQGYVYLVNGMEDAEVCGQQLDGGHRPKLSFNEKFLLPGSTPDHSVEPGPDGSRLVVFDLAEVELCIHTESFPAEPTAGTGAKPMRDHRLRGRKQPRPFLNDADSFDWIVDLTKMNQYATSLCPQVDDPLASNELVAARVRLDQGIVKTADEWHDSRGSRGMRWWRRMWALDYLLWDAKPHEGQSHFPRALPGKAAWRIENVPENAVVLLEDCQEKDSDGLDVPRTLFRLRPRSASGESLQIHVTNAPDKKVGAPGHAHLEHFRWYYRLVDWGGDRCNDLNATGCPSTLPVPVPAHSPGPKGGDVIEGAISETNKCPPGSAGSG